MSKPTPPNGAAAPRLTSIADVAERVAAFYRQADAFTPTSRHDPGAWDVPGQAADPAQLVFPGFDGPTQGHLQHARPASRGMSRRDW